MLYEYLINNYKPNEPIFMADIDLPITNANLRRMFKTLCDLEKIKRYDKGVYYIPKQSRIKGNVSLGTDIYINAKYVTRKGNINGYYSGHTFANQLGISTQVPYVIEIVSNNTSYKYREIELNGRKVILRKSRITVTNDNFQTLQLLDLLTDIQQYSDESINDISSTLRLYMQQNNINRTKIDAYINCYPERIYKSIYDLRLF